MNKLSIEITLNCQDDIQRQAPSSVCKPALGTDFLETRFSRPLLRVSDTETQDVLIKRILGNLREIQDGVQSAGLTLMQKGPLGSLQNQEAAVIEALSLLRCCASQISDDLYPLIKRLSQRKNCNS